MGDHNILNFRAEPGSARLQTSAFNEAIKACHQSGGGRVMVPKGKYICGTIQLLSHVNLHLEEGAQIEGAPNDVNAYLPAEANPHDRYQDFGHSHFQNSLISAIDCENISITGAGTIHGGGITRENKVPAGGADKALCFKSCRNVRIEDVNLVRGGHFAILATDVDHLNIHNVKINTSRDGINVDGCRHVLIRGCHIEAIRYDQNGVPQGGDDAISLKSSFALGRKINCEDILIENCVLRCGGGHGFCVGSETYGDFRNITVRRIKILGADKGGISFATIDGGNLSNLLVEEIVMERVAEPIHIVVGDAIKSTSRPGDIKLPSGRIEDVTLRGIRASDCYGYIKNCEYTSTIRGKPESPIGNIVLEDIEITAKGGSLEFGATPPDAGLDCRPRDYGVRPSWGIYARHVRELQMKNVSLKSEKPDVRPAIMVEHVNKFIQC